MPSKDAKFKPNDPRLIGNKYGKNGGCPRTTSPPKEEVIKLGERLVKWATEPTEELRCRFCEWYTLEENMIGKQWDALLRLPEFRLYYEKARAALGRKLLNGTVNPAMAHRIMWHMVPESAEQEKAKFAAEQEARTAAEIKIAQEIGVTTVNYAGSCKARDKTPA